eukprot:5042537-Pleurochrysis_carterae.AAC.1
MAALKAATFSMIENTAQSSRRRECGTCDGGPDGDGDEVGMEAAAFSATVSWTALPRKTSAS